MDYQIAEINIGRILGPMDSPIMKEFKDNLDRDQRAGGIIPRLHLAAQGRQQQRHRYSRLRRPVPDHQYVRLGEH